MDARPLQGILRKMSKPAPRQGNVHEPPVCNYCWGEHESPKHKGPVVGCQITGSCIKHGIRQCYNCEGHSHFAGSPKCPARGINKEVDADDETQILENRTTSGTHQSRPHESRRGMRAIREKQPAIVVTDTDDTRPSTPPASTMVLSLYGKCVKKCVFSPL